MTALWSCESMSAHCPISKDDVAVLLASALGQHKSDELVASTASALGLEREAYSAADVRGIFDKLVEADGLVGVVARFAVSRGDVDKLVARAERASASAALGSTDAHGGASPSIDSGLPPASTCGPSEIVLLISPALGLEKAREAIGQAATRRGIDPSLPFCHADVLAVLDEMTQVDGIVGVVARFAKARFLLTPPS